MTEGSKVTRQQRIGALVIFVCVLVALIAGAVAPFVLHAKLVRELEADKELLRTYNAQAAHAARLRERRAQLQSSLNSRSGLLQGKTVGSVSAALQDHVSRTAAKQRLDVRSVRILPIERDEVFDRVALVLSVRGTAKMLRNFLFDIETGMPLLFVEELGVRSLRSEQDESGSTKTVMLNINLEIEGFMHRSTDP